MEASCQWAATEVLLKASLSPHEDTMLLAWRDGFVQAFPRGPGCTPRLHVVTGEAEVARAKVVFSMVSNVSVRANNFSSTIMSARHPTSHNAIFYMISWHLMWADNFTTAPHILFFDVDATPILPLRCHHLFDDSERVLWCSWLWHHAAPWVLPDTRVFIRAFQSGVRFKRNLTVLTRGTKGRAAFSAIESADGAVGLSRSGGAVPILDLMAHFPVVVPREVLPEVRRLIMVATQKPTFDEAYVAVGWPCHADLIGKTALLQFPERNTLMHCPSLVHVANELNESGGGHECLGWINPVEHVRHPIQNCERNVCGFINAGQAANYARGLLAEARAFVAGTRPLPPEPLFQYSNKTNPRHPLTYERKLRAAREVMREDWPGRVCGVR